MKPATALTRVFVLLLAASVADTSQAQAAKSGTTPTATAITIDDKAARKISMGIGEEIGAFTVTHQTRVDAATGYHGTEYTVLTTSGSTFKCQIMEPSRVGKIATFGMASGADALCTRFRSTGGDKEPMRPAGNTNLAATDASIAAGSAIAVGDKAMRKMSMAIGRETDQFIVTRQEPMAASPTGMKGTEYTVSTRDGSTYKCQILEPSKLGRIATLGMASGADALCTDFTKGAASQGKTNQANCNALLRAAKKCD